MRVTNRANWQRTKLQAGLILFLVGIGFAGGLDQLDPAQPIPSPVGAIATMALLVWLICNIIKTEGQR